MLRFSTQAALQAGRMRCPLNEAMVDFIADADWWYQMVKALLQTESSQIVCRIIELPDEIFHLLFIV
jgi:hypothetical protein